MTTPSKEATRATGALFAAISIRGLHVISKADAAQIIDTAFAEHRERVRRVSDCAEAASICLATSAAKVFDELGLVKSSEVARTIAEQLDAAIAEVERETVTP